MCFVFPRREEWLHQESNFTGYGSNNARAAQRIKQRFGLGNALEYLVGEKLLRFAEAAEHNPLFAQELPSFVAEIKRVFSAAEVGNYAVTIERTTPLSARQRAAIRAISSISVQIH